jgi:ERF superfamily
MSILAERAAAAAGRTEQSEPPGEDYAPPAAGVTIDLGDYEPGDGDPAPLPVHLAWLAVRRDVRAIAKGELYKGGNTRFNFRGVDTVVNTFGPVTLKHGVSVLPVRVDADYGDASSKNGSKMRECRVCVTWQIIGPLGDSLPLLQTQGEALDSADKGTAKAQSVALRVLLLTGGLTPTHDPDPDTQYLERGEAPARPIASYVDEIAHPGTSAGRLRQIHYELRQAGRLGELVTNETGDEEPIGAMVVRIGKERAAGGAE